MGTKGSIMNKFCDEDGKKLSLKNVGIFSNRELNSGHGNREIPKDMKDSNFIQWNNSKEAAPKSLRAIKKVTGDPLTPRISNVVIPDNNMERRENVGNSPSSVRVKKHILNRINVQSSFNSMDFSTP